MLIKLSITSISNTCYTFLHVGSLSLWYVITMITIIHLRIWWFPNRKTRFAVWSPLSVVLSLILSYSLLLSLSLSFSVSLWISLCLSQSLSFSFQSLSFSFQSISLFLFPISLFLSLFLFFPSLSLCPTLAPTLSISDFRCGYPTGRRMLGPALNSFCIRLNPLLFYITAKSKCQVLD